MRQVNYPSADNYDKWDQWAQALLRTLSAGTAVGVTDVGMTTDFRGPKVPEGWLKCDGSLFSKNGYPELYLTLGNSNVLPNLTSPRGAAWIVGIKAA